VAGGCQAWLTPSQSRYHPHGSSIATKTFGIDLEGPSSVDKGVTYLAAVAALLELAVMLAVVAAYIALARRDRRLWHPLAIIFAGGIIGIAVSVLGELFRDGWSGVPFMLRRSAIGAFGWGVIIAGVVWVGRRLFVTRPKPER